MKGNLEGSDETAVLLKTDRFAIHDGPGIRTSVYFKGCPLRCPWCSNPEAQRSGQELCFLQARCTGCGSCVDSCHRGAITLDDGKAHIDFTECDVCGRCIQACSPRALTMYGNIRSVSYIIDLVVRDRHIYRQSGGGITCTGGEPFQQNAFLLLLLRKCRDLGIHAAIETCGCVDEDAFVETLPYVDWLFFDLKHIDEDRHLKLTGRSNKVILHNLRTASEFFEGTAKSLVVRQVIVPGFNDREAVTEMVDIVRTLPFVTMIELLPYHNYGEDKYQSLGRHYQITGVTSPSEVELAEYKRIAESRGVKCTIGGL